MPDDCQDEIRPECRVELREIHAELRMIRSAVIGNGGRGIKDTVAAHGLALKIIGGAVAIIAVAVLTAALSGCMPATAKLSARLTDVQQAVAAASTSVQAARTATEQAIKVIPADSPAQVPLKAATGHLEAAEGHISKIGEAAADAQEAAAGVVDKKSEWMGLLKLGGVVALMIGALILLGKIGAFAIIKPILKRFGRTIAPERPETASDIESSARGPPPT